MEFRAEWREGAAQGLVQYLSNEMSFLTQNCGEMHCTLVFGDSYLGLDIADDGVTACSISGLSPTHLWKRSSVLCPDAREGRLKLAANELVRGCGYTYGDRWDVFYDAESKAVRIASSPALERQSHEPTYIRFLKNAVAALQGEELTDVFIENITL